MLILAHRYGLDSMSQLARKRPESPNLLFFSRYPMSVIELAISRLLTPAFGMEYAWACAVWNPGFTRFLHEFMRSDKNNFGADLRIDAQGDVPVGAVFRAAVESRMPVECVPFPDGSPIDIGTLADLSVRQRVIDSV